LKPLDLLCGIIEGLRILLPRTRFRSENCRTHCRLGPVEKTQSGLNKHRNKLTVESRAQGDRYWDAKAGLHKPERALWLSHN
jgi:hypothetical protein